MNAASSSNRVPDAAVVRHPPRAAHAAPPRPVSQPLPRHCPAVGGLTPFSTVDWPGTLAAVIFIAGCPWRCHYCHNPELQTRSARYDWRDVRAFLDNRQGLLDAVVFSGGEPLSEPRLPSMIREVRRIGFRIGLHTAGIYPLRLADVLRHLDWVGLDIKADAQGYDDITGRRESRRPAQNCLTQLLAADVAFECRITWHPDWLNETRLLALARDLTRQGVKRFALQGARASPSAPPAWRLGPQAQAALREMFDTFAYR